jgi:hypothetical protein
MSQAADFWFVRLPDGRILRAASTAVVRKEISAGRIPSGSTVRRAPEEEWTAIEWTREFSDLIERREEEARRSAAHRRGHTDATGPATVASRLDPERIQLAGVRGLIQELLGALDSTFVPAKLLTVAVAGLALGILATVVQQQVVDFGDRHLNVTALVAAVLLVVSVPAGVLTRMTYVELSRLRLARWHEGLDGLGWLVVRLLVTLGLVGASGWGLIVLLRWLPYWLLPGGNEGVESWARDAAAGSALAAGMAFEVGLWAVLGVAGLLAPLLVIEECSVTEALGQWLGLLREHLGRVFLFEALALGVGLGVAVPGAVLLLPLHNLFIPGSLSLAGQCAWNLLCGLAVAPFMGYVIVANVFIYLHLRYALAPQRRRTAGARQ